MNKIFNRVAANSYNPHQDLRHLMKRQSLFTRRD